MSVGLDPALARLIALKWKGRVRVAWRRLCTPKGFVFGLVGAALLVLWAAGLALRLRAGEALRPAGDVTAPAALAITVYALFAVTANLSWRGLYLPKPELERLFSAPLSRRSLVRYRLLGMAAPTSFVALLVGLITAARVPAPAAGFLGGALVVGATTVLGQGAALLAAREDGGLGRWLARLPGGTPRMIGALGLAAVLLALLFADDLAPERDFTTIVRGGEVLVLDRDGNVLDGRGRPIEGSRSIDGSREAAEAEVRGLAERLRAFAEHPATRVVTAPAYPFAAAVAADDLRRAAPWLALCFALVLALFELVARLPVDYREASLATSQDVERRLAKLRRGQIGAAASESHSLVGWRVPWVFGHGPFGAVLWLKTATLLRQGRGALAVAMLTTAVGVVVGVMLMPEPGVGTGALVLLGVAYLASGLRFDFRVELDRMSVLRAWPLPPWQVFVGGILPVSLFVSLFVGLMLTVRALVLGSEPLDALLGVLAVPLVAFLWVALDNAVFLLFPVRFVPGMGGALQHSGRALLMVLLRVLVLAVAGVASAGAGLLASYVAERLGLGLAVVYGAMVSSVVLTSFGFAALLAALGGFALARFDPVDAARAT